MQGHCGGERPSGGRQAARGAERGPAAKPAVTLALAGQPNVGKSTVFNRLTGLSQHVGNWPGKTVEQKTGECSFQGERIRLVDLPGTYSLTANSEEERIARDYILKERPDVVVALLNASALERNLYLVAELLLLDRPIVVGLNMLDVAEAQGIKVEPNVLSAALHLPVIPLVASKNEGLLELLAVALELARHPDRFAPQMPSIREAHRPILKAIEEALEGQLPDPYSPAYVAMKVLEGDAELSRMVQEKAPGAWQRIHPLLMAHEDAYIDIAGGRYEWIARMARAALTRPKAGVITITDRIDRFATHPLWGVGILFSILAATFWLTYTIATPMVNLLDHWMLGTLAPWVGGLLLSAPRWLSGFVTDGLIGGAGMVITFLPILLVFFALLGFLEDVGYMARMAYVMDRFMHRLGLHGKSFMPLFLGFGCNIPAVLGTRIIEDRRSRLLTLLLVPLVPCTARLSVVAFLAPVFFPRTAAWVMTALVAGNLLLLVFLGVLLNRFAFKGHRGAFIMEMPLYHAPNLRTIGLFVWNNIQGFLKKAGTVIVAVSAVVWALSAYPGPGMNHSLLADFGRWLVPFGRWMGLGDWRLLVSLLTSFIAKENSVATLGVLFAAGDDRAGLGHLVASAMTPQAALAFLVVQMTFLPCVSTVAATKQEAGWRWAFVSILLLLALSILAGIVVFRLGALWC
ncbi:MAG: ferrous iron transport protein B [Acidobacteriota bacterium]